MYKRLDYKRPVLKPVDLSVSNTELIQSGVIDNLLFEELEMPNGDKALLQHRDVYLIFDQKRLNSLGVDAVNAFLERFNRKLPDTMSPMSDDQLFMFIKDKNIQTMSELQMWDDYLKNNQQALVDDYNSRLEAQQQKDVDAAADGDDGNVVVNPNPE